MPEQTLAAPAVEELARAFGGDLVQPGNGGYDEARLVWNGIHDRHPALIARCTTPEDVVAAVNFARTHDLTVAVRGGGHSAPGYGTCDDGIVIDLSPMNKVEVDPGAKTARAGRAPRGESSTPRRRSTAWP
jgi:FAD/FMN-containing dehydrogenase